MKREYMKMVLSSFLKWRTADEEKMACPQCSNCLRICRLFFFLDGKTGTYAKTVWDGNRRGKQ